MPRTVRLREPLGDGDFALSEGAEFTVVERLPPGTPGVETSTQSVVVVEHVYDAPALRDGEWVTVAHTRRLAFPEDRFHELFEPNKKEPSQ